METVVQPPADAELHLLTEWGDPAARSRRRKAALLSVLGHAAAITALVWLPAGLLEPPPRTTEVRVTPLIEPLTELTQKAPNKGKVSKEFDAAEVRSRPRIQIPAGLLSTTRPQAPRPAEVPVPAPEPAAPLPEPPKVEAAAPPQLPPPQIQPVEQPKLAFEAPRPAPTGQARAPEPNSTVTDAIRQTIRGGSGGLMVGDLGASGVGGYGSGINRPPSPGAQGSNLQLLSDPQGVDFRPYLMQILAAVRRNWMAVMPESVKLGRRGRVAIQFSIGRDGGVPKLVIAAYSGADALDRAAVAGISASVPFPPLPTEFKGDRIVLQLNFAYNMPKQ
jgi:TonB family protein